MKNSSLSKMTDSNRDQRYDDNSTASPENIEPKILKDLSHFLEKIKQSGCERIYLPVSVRESLFSDFLLTSEEKTPPPQTPKETSTEPAVSTAKPESARQSVPPSESSSPPLESSHEKAEIYQAPDLQTLSQIVTDCSLCGLHQTRNKPVFGKGSTNAEIMFINEAPEELEDKTGEAFSAQTGQLLARMIKAMQFSKEQVYLANIVKCRPPGGRKAEINEINACLQFIKKEIELVQPKAVILFGTLALKAIIGEKSITRCRGKWFNYGSIPAMPTFHPSFLLQSPEAKKTVWGDMQKVMKYFNRDPRESIRRMRQEKAERGQ